MLIAVTGATGFLGRYVVNHLLGTGHRCRCWYRQGSDRGGFVLAQGQTGKGAAPDGIEWVPGELADAASAATLVAGADAVVHAALDRPATGYRPAPGTLVPFLETNLMGSLRLMQAARSAGVKRFVFISTCAVHEIILQDRVLDEAHPLWPGNHYGAHKAAIEKFVHSFGIGEKWDICALRPTGIYGLARPAEDSRFLGVVRQVVEGQPVSSASGGKEVHAADVAKAVGILLAAPGIAGQAYNCCDLYVAEQDVARIAKEITGSPSAIEMLNKGPKNQISTAKIRGLGMEFGGRKLLEQTVRELVEVARAGKR